jgi:anthranilate phosphoribosyltransferase
MKNGDIKEYEIIPEDFGFQRSSIEDLFVDSPKESLDIARLALAGKHESAGSMISMTAGAALYVSGIANSLKSGVELAKECVGDGGGLKKLNQLVEYTSQF